MDAGGGSMVGVEEGYQWREKATLLPEASSLAMLTFKRKPSKLPW